MLEVMTPEQKARYVEIANPEYLAQAFGVAIPQNIPSKNLNLIG